MIDNKTIRIGRLMEILDYVSVTVCYKYCYFTDLANKPATIIAACMDNIKFFKTLNCDQDLILTAYPTYVGKSSLEIQCDLSQINKESKMKEIKACATFLMVARDAKDHSKPYSVPQLSFEGEANQELCQIRFEIAMKHQ